MTTEKKTYYAIWDSEQHEIKKSNKVFNNTKESYSSFADTLKQQCLDGGGGYEDYTLEEIHKDLEEKTDKDLFDMFGYSLKTVTSSDYFLYSKTELIDELKIDNKCSDVFFLVTSTLEILETSTSNEIFYDGCYHFKEGNRTYSFAP